MNAYLSGDHPRQRRLAPADGELPLLVGEHSASGHFSIRAWIELGRENCHFVTFVVRVNKGKRVEYTLFPTKIDLKSRMTLNLVTFDSKFSYANNQLQSEKTYLHPSTLQVGCIVLYVLPKDTRKTIYILLPKEQFNLWNWSINQQVFVWQYIKGDSVQSIVRSAFCPKKIGLESGLTL